MQLASGKSYLVGESRQHAIDVLSIAPFLGFGTVAICEYYHIGEPDNTTTELYQPDGIYRMNREPDPDWDVVGEYKKPGPPSEPMEMTFPTGLYDKHGNPMHVFAPTEYLQKHGLMGFKILSTQEAPEGHTRIIIRIAKEG